MKKPPSPPQSPDSTGKKESDRSGRDDDDDGDDGDNGADKDPDASTASDIGDVMTRLMDRLACLQCKVEHQQEELLIKDRHIRQLQDNLYILSLSRGRNPGQAADQGGEVEEVVVVEEEEDGPQQGVQKMEHQCLVLQRQIHEMESFLADYGMVWVGEERERVDCSSAARAALWGLTTEEEDDEDTGQPGTLFHIDFDRLMDNIQELNTIAGEPETNLQHTVSGARFRTLSPVKVTFHANGLIMADGPFRPYSEPATRQCVLDFLDGYFPSELQSRYPEGVPFSVTDMRHVTFQSGSYVSVFTGVGNILGVSSEHCQLCFNEAESSDETHLAQDASPGPSVDTLLNTLAKSVAVGNTAHSPRDVNVGGKLDGESRHADHLEVIEVETEVTKASQGASSEEKAAVPPGTSTLRVKSESGNDTYLLHIFCTETIGHLRQYLNAHRRKDNVSDDYLICSTHPSKVYADDSVTLQSCGLVPNGVLYLQAGRNK